jgi:putative heme-binding domain-containing protein
MYRETIEHPWSIPADLLAQLDLLSGRDRGRIYRLAPRGFQPPAPPRLGRATTDQLVVQLANPNCWWRETAHRLIFERQDSAAVAPLRRLLRESDRPLARLAALWSLAGLNALDEADLTRALADDVAGIREHAVRLAEPRLGQAPTLREQVLALARDPVVRVRFQVAFTLGEMRDPRVADALTEIARRDADDVWVRTAVLSSAVDSCDRMLLQVLPDDSFIGSEAGQALARQLATVVGARNRAPELKAVCAAVARNGQALAVQQQVVAGLGDGLKRAGKNLRQIQPQLTPEAGQLLDMLLAAARQTAQSDPVDLAQREQAIGFLAYDDFEHARTALVPLLDARQPQAVQMTAVRTLAGFANAQVAALLLAPWRTYTPTVRRETIEALLARRDRIPALFDAVERRIVAVGDIPPNRRDVLMRYPDESLRKRAIALFGRDALGTRKEVVARYQPALQLTPDRARGEQVFRRECLTCHRLGNQGREVGPNLSTVAHLTPEEVMISILDPNREVSPNYVEYLIMLKEGRTTSGLIASETATSITLRRAENVQETILRQNIEEINSTGKSLMPEGLEQKLTLQDMADLLAFLVRRR